MVELDIEKINRESPYLVERVSDGEFSFVTDYGIEYIICFEPDDILLRNEAYQFSIVNKNGLKSPLDRKLRNTIMSVIYEFFSCNNATILYICETGDGKQGLRSRLFESWYNASLRKAAFAVFSASITDPEGVINYASIILRTDNPHFTEVIQEFSDTVRLLSKP